MLEVTVDLSSFGDGTSSGKAKLNVITSKHVFIIIVCFSNIFLHSNQILIYF